MKLLYSLFGMCLLIFACQPKADNSAKEKFERNSQTVRDNLKGFVDENVDYTQYADDFIMAGTTFGSKDSLNLDDIKKNDKEMWEQYDFKILTDPLVLLPGVNPDTKEPDGSVRYYADWQVTVPATDSTEAKSGVIHFYESFDFNDEGKIIYQQGYGDFGGLFSYLHGDDDDGEEMD